MEVPVVNMKGEQVRMVSLPSEIFQAKINVGLMHQAYVRQLANARQGTHQTKTRSDVTMTTAKMYRQKGTGRARHGSRSAALFVGGGIAHGPKPRDYTQRMPKKMRRLALFAALSALLRDGQLVFVDDLRLDSPKTKTMKEIIRTLTGGDNALVLIVQGSQHENVQRSVGNLPQSQALWVNYLNIRDLLRYDKVIVPLAALEVITSLWGDKVKDHA